MGSVVPHALRRPALRQAACETSKNSTTSAVLEESGCKPPATTRNPPPAQAGFDFSACGYGGADARISRLSCR